MTILNQWLELCREVYNAGIEERKEAWKQGVNIGLYDQYNEIPEIRLLRPEVALVHSQVIREPLRRLDLAFQSFFRRCKNGEKPGYPRFKSRDRYNSLTWPQNEAFNVVGTKRLRLGKIGEVRIKLHRPLNGKPKTCTVKREGGKWFAVISCDNITPKAWPQPSASEIGIDLGLESFITLSSGERIENPRWYRKTEIAIKNASMTLTKKKLGSSNYYKIKKQLRKLHAKAANQRLDFHHKLSARSIAVEDLMVNELITKSPSGLSKSINDAGWRQFLNMLSYKAEEAGRKLIKVPPQHTSSTCSGCGTQVKKELCERTHKCSCGVTLSRDHNAAINILRLGRSLQPAS